LLGKLSAIVVLSQPSMPMSDRATDHDRRPSVARARVIRSTRPDICCEPE